jgi:hypothetical protein
VSFSRQASGGLGMGRVSYLHFDLSLAMAIHSSKSFEMPLLLSAFSNAIGKSRTVVLDPHVFERELHF